MLCEGRTDAALSRQTEILVFTAEGGFSKVHKKARNGSTKTAGI